MLRHLTSSRGLYHEGTTVTTQAPKPKIPTRTFRCHEDLWQAAKAKAADEDMTVTDVLIMALQVFVED